MSVQAVREYLARFGVDGRIQEFTESSATVELAAAVVGVIPARIAKTLSFKDGAGAMLVVAAGDAKVDNRKFKDTFGFKAKCSPPGMSWSLSGTPSAVFAPLRSRAALRSISMSRFSGSTPFSPQQAAQAARSS